RQDPSFEADRVPRSRGSHPKGDLRTPRETGDRRQGIDRARRCLATRRLAASRCAPSRVARHGAPGRTERVLPREPARTHLARELACALPGILAAENPAPPNLARGDGTMTPQPETETKSISMQWELSHPPAKVWRALTEPELLRKWLMETDLQPVAG